MREVKYRAWSIENECYLDMNFDMISSYYMNSSYFFLAPNGTFYEAYKTIDGDEYCEVAVDIQFYTGLKDCKGCEIFEGDIVKAKIGAIDFILKIEFEHGKFMAVGDDDLTAFDLFTITDKCEIIGNIYEKSELLKWKS